LIHGTADTDVPFEESVTMARELARHGVAHELILLPESGHGLGGGDPALEDDAQNRAVAFIHRHLAGEARSAEIEPLLKAFALSGEASTLAGQGKIAEAKGAYAESLALEPRLPERAQMWNRLCWQGGLWGQAAEVLSACDRAVELTTSPNAGILDSRALVRALAGDLEGAIEDLEAIMDIQVNEDALGQVRWREIRRGWLIALRAGDNPYTTALLESLRDQ
jgi:tetratricopeptide (TPR) repeat protein